MKSISIKDLKLFLARYAEEVARGQTIHVTKYNKPFIQITPAAPGGLRLGSRVGKASLKPVAKAATKGYFLKCLEKDRNEDG